MATGRRRALNAGLAVAVEPNKEAVLRRQVLRLL